uniref:Orotidine 5'-phosphate decarboxylase n=1 Tax=Desulfatirhabdium butyrativorans TaxID=340467 RepID=A0A7C4MMJ6_9BACT
MHLEHLTEAGRRIVFPLDVPAAEQAMALIDLLGSYVGIYKIGLELFLAEGPHLVSRIVEKGFSVFLDLKLHDIPKTVERAMRRVAGLGVDWITVHSGESPAMLEAAVIGAGGEVRVLAVTVLTSVEQADLTNCGYDPTLSLADVVDRKARMAKAAGCAGIVCSGHEVARIKSDIGADLVTFTPGIRPLSEGERRDDQKRVMTPAAAVRAGADYLIIGRPIRDAADPAAAAKRITEEIAGALSD